MRAVWLLCVFKADDMQGQNRHKGYVRALQEAGILYDPDKVVWFHTEDRKLHPYEAIREMAGGTLRGQPADLTRQGMPFGCLRPGRKRRQRQ